jgi:predicted negative regulator of RcsB-dependent stress response
MKTVILLLAGLLLFSSAARADTVAQSSVPCAGTDRACLLRTLDATTASIDQSDWRDQTYRELAKLLTHNGQPDQAIALIAKIKDPDTKAMTIRGIGMAAASMHLAPATYTGLFKKLRTEADGIQHPPSHAIALTYIAMSQAFAGDNNGAMKTAAGMQNAELRNKAFNEAAKIQADRGDFNAAFASIAAIDDPAFRDKAHYTIAKIFADGGKYDMAVASSAKIVNTYQRSQALLYLLAKQITPEKNPVSDEEAMQ